MAQKRTRCYHCNVESDENTFKYFDNGKRTQPRYECSNCQKLFTLGSHGRVQGRTYSKKRNVDPPELQGLPRECRCCGMADNAPFRYYNNKNLSQPRFQCLSCGQAFQMRVMGTGQERRLVHTSSQCYQRQSSSSISRDRQNQPGPAPNSGNERFPAMPTLSDLWMPVLSDLVDGFPPLSDEDARYLDLIEVGLEDEKQAPPAEAVSRLQSWASKLPQPCR